MTKKISLLIPDDLSPQQASVLLAFCESSTEAIWYRSESGVVPLIQELSALDFDGYRDSLTIELLIPGCGVIPEESQ